MLTCHTLDGQVHSDYETSFHDLVTFMLVAPSSYRCLSVMAT